MEHMLSYEHEYLKRWKADFFYIASHFPTLKVVVYYCSEIANYEYQK